MSRSSDAGYHEFWKAAREHYPEAMKPGGMLDQGAIELIRNVVSSKPDGRFVKPTEREWICDFDGWMFPKRSGAFRYERAMALTYKGLINLKTPFDLALYERLIWELQPRTILELGSFQGGSGLWFADQMTVSCREPCEVHSFDLYTKCRSASAKHPRLHFHQVDLMDLDSFDAALLERLPHPWIVVDDSHIKVFEVFQFLNRFLAPGDYYVMEDVPMLATVRRRRNKIMFVYEKLLNRLKKHRARVVAGAKVFEDAGFMVDTHYTDAYAYNMTCSPNSWFRKGGSAAV